jgi:23S rRNA pseudouridine1911/1915/1917 synthase
MTQNSIHKLKSEENGVRLDAFLVKELPALGRKRAKEICDSGSVKVNGRVRKMPGSLLKAGDDVEVLTEVKEVSAGETDLTMEKALELIDIVYEDQHLLIVNKTRQMHSVKQRNDKTITLADCLAVFLPKLVNVSPDKREAGLLQRLDYYTSGLCMVAKTKGSYAAFREEFSDDNIKKTYLALVEGRMEKEKINILFPIIQGKDKKKVTVITDGSEKAKAVEAVTNISKAKEKPFAIKDSKASFVVATGRSMCRHQVRAHLSAIGYPLVGDELYGAEHTLNQIVKKPEPDLNEGFYLSATAIEFVHPFSHKKIKVEV